MNINSFLGARYLSQPRGFYNGSVCLKTVSGLYFICHSHTKCTKIRIFYYLKQSGPVYLKLDFSGDEKFVTCFEKEATFAKDNWVTRLHSTKINNCTVTKCMTNTMLVLPLSLTSDISW